MNSEWNTGQAIIVIKEIQIRTTQVCVFKLCVYEFSNFSQNILSFTYLIESNFQVYVEGYSQQLYKFALITISQKYKQSDITLTYSPTPNDEGWTQSASQVWTQSMNYLPCNILSLNSQFHNIHVLILNYSFKTLFFLNSKIRYCRKHIMITSQKVNTDRYLLN